MIEKKAPNPSVLTVQIALAMRGSRALAAAVELNIADHLSNGARSSADLAVATGTDATAIRRLLRALAALGIFSEEEPDTFALSAASECLCSTSPDSLGPGVLFLAGDVRWQVWSDLLESLRTGEAATKRVLGMDLFEYYAANPEQYEIHDQAMAGFTALASEAMLNAFDFSSFRRLVNVGGGTGRFVADILAAHPNLHGLVFDLPHVVAGTPTVLARCGVAGRCSVEGGSFFDAVPSGGDAYLLKQILHDWDDPRAIAILKACREAMPASGTLLIFERVMPERAQQGRDVEAFLVDLEMLIVTPGGRERTEAEFRNILSVAGLAITQVVPTAGPISIIEARSTAYGPRQSASRATTGNLTDSTHARLTASSGPPL